jgi:hypothetical protein
VQNMTCWMFDALKVQYIINSMTFAFTNEKVDKHNAINNDPASAKTRNYCEQAKRASAMVRHPLPHKPHAFLAGHVDSV